MRKFYLKIACLATAILCAASCVDTGELESQLSGLEDRVSALEQTASKVNENTIAIYSMLVEGHMRTGQSTVSNSATAPPSTSTYPRPEKE